MRLTGILLRSSTSHFWRFKPFFLFIKFIFVFYHMQIWKDSWSNSKVINQNGWTFYEVSSSGCRSITCLLSCFLVLDIVTGAREVKSDYYSLLTRFTSPLIPEYYARWIIRTLVRCRMPCYKPGILLRLVACIWDMGSWTEIWKIFSTAFLNQGAPSMF